MATNFPGSNDSFSPPVSPGTTHLVDPDASGRSHTQSHRDMGDALMAMQAQATLLVHSHDGSTFRHGSKLAQANTHQSVDTDSATSSLHHTIGTGANQGASGTHTHPVVATYPVGAFFFAAVSTYPGITDPVSGNPGLGLIGNWTAVQNRFLCAQGGALGFAAGATGGSNSHSHTMDATSSSAGGHGHTMSSSTTGNAGGHTHGGNNLTSTTFSHYHDLNGTSSGLETVNSGSGAGNPGVSHYHGGSSTSTTHSHSAPTTGSVDDHNHTISSTSVASVGDHTHPNSQPASANNLIPLFVVYMWKRTS